MFLKGRLTSFAGCLHVVNRILWAKTRYLVKPSFKKKSIFWKSFMSPVDFMKAYFFAVFFIAFLPPFVNRVEVWKRVDPPNPLPGKTFPKIDWWLPKFLKSVFVLEFFKNVMQSFHHNQAFSLQIWRKLLFGLVIIGQKGSLHPLQRQRLGEIKAQEICTNVWPKFITKSFGSSPPLWSFSHNPSKFEETFVPLCIGVQTF